MRKKSASKREVFVSVKEMSREELEEAALAAELKQAFREKWLGVYKKEYSKNPRADNREYWLRAARLIKELGASPGSFIEAQFSMSKHVCLPSHLGSEIAAKRYRSYAAARGFTTEKVKESMLDNNARIDPGKAEARELIANHVKFVRDKYGIHDTNSPKHIDLLVNAPWLFDPMAACMLSPTREVLEIFGEGAKDRLRQYPYLRDAFKALGFDSELSALTMHNSDNTQS